MSLQIIEIEDVLILKPKHERLDSTNCIQLKAAIKESFGRGHRKIIVDLSLVSFIDSFALVTLLACHKMIQPEARLLIAALQKKLVNGVSLTRLRNVLNIVDTPERAMLLLAGKPTSEPPPAASIGLRTFLPRFRYA